MVIVRETELTDKVVSELIRLSADWESENSCTGYRKNERSDIEGTRVFLAEEDSVIVGYLFGKEYEAENNTSVMKNGTKCFEVEELYVVPELRSRGIGTRLFRYLESELKDKAEYIVLSTATKNWKAIMHFYVEELGMDFWSARLYRKI